MFTGIPWYVWVAAVVIAFILIRRPNQPLKGA